MDTKHYFIFNPQAGSRSALPALQSQLEKIAPVPYTVLVTGGRGDATRLVKEVCEKEEGHLRFYACGGDGTLGEVASGLAGNPKAAAGFWPCGSGNDYARIYGGQKRFQSIANQISAPTVLVDLISVNKHHAINVVNLGLEAMAAATMLKFRHNPLFGGKRAYLPGALSAVISGMKTPCRVVVDDELLYEGDLLTASFASGQFIGGGFYCAPRAVNDDGLMDVSLILPFTRGELLRLLPVYKKGAHLDHPALEGKLLYRQGKHAVISAKEEILLCLDGEIVKGRRFDLRVQHRSVRFILPPEN